MRTGSLSKAAGWPRIAAVACLFLALPGCATSFVQNKIDTNPRPPSHMGDVEAAGRSTEGTVSLCMYRVDHRSPLRVMLSVPIHSNEQQTPRKTGNGTDQAQPNQTGAIPYLSVPASTALPYCLKPASPVPVFLMTTAHVSGSTYKLGRIDPGTNWGTTDNIPLAMVMSDARLRKEIRDRIVAHEAPVGIYQLPIMPPGGTSSRSAVFYKYSFINTAHPEFGNTRVVQLGTSGETKEDGKINSPWSLLLPVTYVVDIVTSPIQAIYIMGAYVYYKICDCSTGWVF